VSRGGKWERMAVRLNAILRKLPKNAALDGKQWHAETGARRSIMRYIVGIVARLIEEEDERAREAETSDGGADVKPTRITIGGTVVDLSDLKPGDTIDIRATDSSPTQVLPVERVLTPAEEAGLGIRRRPADDGPVIVKRTAPHSGPQVSSCPVCGKAIVALFDRDVREAEWLAWHKPGCTFARLAVEEAEKLAAGACGWCGMLLPAPGAKCPCIPF